MSDLKLASVHDLGARRRLETRRLAAVLSVERVPILSMTARWVACALAVLLALGAYVTTSDRHQPTAEPPAQAVADPYANLLFPGSTREDMPADRTPYIEQMLAARQAMR